MPTQMLRQVGMAAPIRTAAPPVCSPSPPLTLGLHPLAVPQDDAQELRSKLERTRATLEGLKAAQHEYVQSAKKVKRAERKLADQQAADKVGAGARPGCTCAHWRAGHMGQGHGWWAAKSPAA